MAHGCTHKYVKTALTLHGAHWVAAMLGWRGISALAVCCLHSIGWAGIWVHGVLVYTGEESFLKVLHVVIHKSGGKMQCSPWEFMCLIPASGGSTQKQREAQKFLDSIWLSHLQ